MYLEETADYLFPVFVAHILIEFVNLQPSDYSIPTLYLRKSVCENPEVLEFEGILGEKATDPSNGSDYQHMPAMQSWTYKP